MLHYMDCTDIYHMTYPNRSSSTDDHAATQRSNPKENKTAFLSISENIPSDDNIITPDEINEHSISNLNFKRRGLNFCNLNIRHFERKDRDQCDKIATDNGGGILMYIANHVTYTRRTDFESQYIESIWIEVQLKK